MEENQNQINELPFFTSEEFSSSKFKSRLGEIKALELRKIQRGIEAIIESYEPGLADWRVARLFLIICSVHFDVHKREVYSPMMVISEGERTLIPSDISSAQWDEINKIVEQISCTLLRAFIADMMWTCDKSRWMLPELACQSFCIVIQEYLNGGESDEFDAPEFVSNSAIDFLERTFQIIAGAGRKKEVPDYVERAWAGLMDESIKKKHAAAYVRLADIGLDSKIIDYLTVAETAETIATGSSQSYPMAEKKLWELAAFCHEKLKDTENRLRCRLKMVAQTLRMRDAVSQALAKASWTRDAIQELRQIGGQKDQIRVLWNELLELQDAALDELGHFSLPLDITSQIAGTTKAFSGKSLSEMLRYFCVLARPVDVEDLKKSAIETMKSSPLMAMMGMSRSDREGRIISNSPGAELEGNPSAEWLKNQSLQYMDVYYHQVVGGGIHPAINVICAQEAVYERYFYAIIEQSPFVPLGFRENYSKGFWMMFQGDFIGAAYLLIPMLENSLRYVLSITNQDSSKMLPDSTQEDRSLSGLLENMRSELEEIFGVNTVNEIDLLFNFKGGPSLRHEVAHGKLTSGDCHHHSAIYGCWLIYRLACLPMLKGWEDNISPVLDSLK